MKITENSKYIVKDRATHQAITNGSLNPAIREELDQTPAWWDRQYRKLVQKRIPRSATYHEGHEIEEERTYADLRVFRWCLECGVSIDDYEEN